MRRLKSPFDTIPNNPAVVGTSIGVGDKDPFLSSLTLASWNQEPLFVEAGPNKPFVSFTTQQF
jgi:hypothetical protein